MITALPNASDANLVGRCFWEPSFEVKKVDSAEKGFSFAFFGMDTEDIPS